VRTAGKGGRDGEFIMNLRGGNKAHRQIRKLSQGEVKNSENGRKMLVEGDRGKGMAQ